MWRPLWSLDLPVHLVWDPNGDRNLRKNRKRSGNFTSKFQLKNVKKQFFAITLYDFLRCYNCGDLAHHIASKCSLGPQPKRCHHCKGTDHLIADCTLRAAKNKVRIFRFC